MYVKASCYTRTKFSEVVLSTSRMPPVRWSVPHRNGFRYDGPRDIPSFLAAMDAMEKVAEAQPPR
jgi:hypothetical protein